MSNFFNQCNMVIRTYMEFNKFGLPIKLPFHFHIKDIKQDFFELNDDENVLEDYPMELQHQKTNTDTTEYNLFLLKYVDLKSFTIDFDKSDLDEYGGMVEKYRDSYIFKDHTYLYSFLIDRLVFSDVDFNEIENFVLESQARLKSNYEKFLIKELEIGSNKKDPSESYMLLRCAFELNRPPIFDENIQLNIAKVSWREYITQRIYIGRKCEIEKLQYDEVMKKGNNNK